MNANDRHGKPATPHDGTKHGDLHAGGGMHMMHASWKRFAAPAIPADVTPAMKPRIREAIQ